jgi:tripartite-type tricarboxylate transporter receptor subunit TctC
MRLVDRVVARRQFIQGAAAAIALPETSGFGWSQSGYPVRPVRVIVPFAPGGGVDILARLTAQQLSKRLGQQFYVENIGGAAGNIGTGQAARATPDGYTVLFVFGSFVVSPSLFASVPYDVKKDFAPVTLEATTPTVLVINPSLPVQTAKQLIDLIRANPGKYNFAHGGVGTQAHLASEQVRLSLSLDVVQVPFAGAGPATASVVAGHTPIGFISLAAIASQIKAGKLRALAVTGKTRSQILPDVPTMAEAGFANVAGDSWVGVLVPAGTPNGIVAILHREIAGFIQQPDTRERLTALGYQPVANTPEEFSRLIATEFEVWADVIRAAKIDKQ